MTFEYRYIENIISANNDNSLAIFVGAGISKCSETDRFKLPDWKELISSLKQDLNNIDESDFLKIAQLYYLAFGEHSYHQKLKSFFPEFISPSEIHKIIFELNPHVVLTTNWDNILERTIEDNAYIFDVICSDTDLVKSSLQNKLVKMHGDFKNNNIVFKEDDYINYKFNFPLIENYVKSILSTHTILFLGYSYNDVNLKQILNWIKNHSSARPPIYLTTFENNPTQIRYLENHGITSILLTKEHENYLGNSYSKKMFAFLSRIKEQEEQKALESDNQVIDFVYKKIHPLNDLRSILIDQVQKSISNCGFIFDSDSLSILRFYSGILTTDFNANKRVIYEKFIEILRKVDSREINISPKILNIIDILKKSNIKGISLNLDKDSDNKIEYFNFSEYVKDPDNCTLDDSFNFKYSLSDRYDKNIYKLLCNAFANYNLGKSEEAYQASEEAVTECLKKRSYTLMFIAMFNRNMILRRLKYSFDHREKYKDIKDYDLKERFYNLPKNLRLALEPVYEFVDFSFMYKYVYLTSQKLKAVESSKKTVQAGGLVFNSNTDEYSSKHKNLVSFILENKIIFERQPEYQNINKYFVEIAILRQVLKESVVLNKTEIYSCIKYCTYKDIRLIFKSFYRDSNDSIVKLELDETNKNWLITTVFPNIVNEHIGNTCRSNPFQVYLKNALFMISLLSLSEEEVNRIVDFLQKIILNDANSLEIYDSINLFLGIQYKLHGMKIKKESLVILLEGIINKLIYNRNVGNFYYALTRNKFSNLYGYAAENKAILDNTDLVTRLLSEIDYYNTSDKIEIIQNFLLDIFYISNNEIKKEIENFILKINLDGIDNQYLKIVFELSLFIHEIKDFSDEIVVDLNKYLEEYKDGLTFTSGFYTLDQQLDYLMENRNLKIELNTVSKTIKSLIDMYEQRINVSVF